MSDTIFPIRLGSPSGLSVQVNANGSIRRIDYGDLILNLFLGNELEGGTTNLYLRRLGASIEAVPLLGPCSPATFQAEEGRLTCRGEWNGIRFTVALALARTTPAWFWHVELANIGAAETVVDLIHTQDVALAHYGAIRMNEYYVSQYIDHTPLAHVCRGTVLGVRQNLSMSGHNPWLLLGSLHEGVSFATDALQFHGLQARAGGGPAALDQRSLAGRRHQHEHSMAVIQDAPLHLAAGGTARRGFFAWLEAHHADATSDADLGFVDKALALEEATPHPCLSASVSGDVASRDAATRFSACSCLETRDLTEAESERFFGSERRDLERERDRDLSFFTAAGQHVVVRAKELAVLRPHGHIMRTGNRLEPDEASLTSTVWMSGVFHSMVTQGHVSINRFLSTTHSYLGLYRSHGLRIFADWGDGDRLLGVPSVFEIGPSACRWIYAHAGGVLQVRSWAPVDRHELNLSIEVLAGSPCRFLLSHHVALNGDDGAEAIPVRFVRDADGVVMRSVPESDVGRRFPDGSFRIDIDPTSAVERVQGDEALFLDGCSRDQPYVCITTKPTRAFATRITGHLIESPDTPRTAARPLPCIVADEAAADAYWALVTGRVVIRPRAESALARDAVRVADIFPWFAHDALIHYLAPRGLEQYSGGGWGTRDVCQGPVEMLLSIGRFDAVRDVLVRVFKTQNPDGDWPQWFMFFDRERNIRPGDSHGDIVFWPLLALAEYLSASEDVSLLEEVLPFFHPEGDGHAESVALWTHVERACAVIDKRVIPGTSLPAYGHGDWNDALQPVDPAMCERLSSAWTATLHYQTYRALAQALTRLGREQAATRLDAAADRVRDDFRKYMIVDGTIAAYAYFADAGVLEYLLHPRDESSAIHYSVLPMIHAILVDLVTPEQASRHIQLIRRHLLGPDGVHLFDRPFPYHGGPQQRFQRAESASFFGREIGNMYMHAHLRYAQAMARYGDADAFFLALRQANPIGVRDVVASAALRQRNCYYSSSDPAFADRYEGFDEYGRVGRGEVPIEGGWRVYSSGAGIALRLLRECFLGVREGKAHVVFDPVMPKSLDGLSATLDVQGRGITIVYRVGEHGRGPVALTFNGVRLAFEREPNPYRSGAARVRSGDLVAHFAERNTLVIELE